MKFINLWGIIYTSEHKHINMGKLGDNFKDEYKKHQFIKNNKITGPSDKKERYGNVYENEKEFRDIDVKAISEKVAEKGIDTPKISDAIGSVLDSGSLLPKEVEYIQNPQNTDEIVKNILLSRSQVAADYLAKALAVENALNKSMQATDLANHAQAFENAANVAQYGSALAGIFKDQEEMDSLIQQLDRGDWVTPVQGEVELNEEENYQAEEGDDQEGEPQEDDQAPEDEETQPEEDTQGESENENSGEQSPDEESDQEKPTESKEDDSQDKNAAPVPPITEQDTNKESENETEQEKNETSEESGDEDENDSEDEAKDDKEIDEKDDKNEELTDGVNPNKDAKEDDNKEDNQDNNEIDKSKPDTSTPENLENQKDEDGEPKEDDPNLSTLDRIRSGNNLPKSSDPVSSKSVSSGGGGSAPDINLPSTPTKPGGKLPKAPTPKPTSPTPQSGGIGSRLSQGASKVASNAGKLASQAGKQASRLAGQAAASAASSLAAAILPILPWILLGMVVLTFIFGLLAGTLVAIYCYTDDFNLGTIRNGLEYGLTGDRSFLASEAASRIGLGRFIETKVETKSELGKFIEQEICVELNPNSCGVTGAPSTNLNLCLSQELAGRDPTDTIPLWRAQNNVSTTPVDIQTILDVIDAGQQAGVSSEAVAFTLSKLATESYSAGLWKAQNSIPCYGITQICAGSAGTFSYENWTQGALGSVPSPETFLNNPVMQMKTIQYGLDEKKAILQSGACKLTNGKSDAYGIGVLWLGCYAGGDGGVTPFDYGEATERNFNLITCNGTNNDIVYHDNSTGLSIDDIAHFLTTRSGLEYILGGGVIKAEARIDVGTYTYGDEAQAIADLIGSGRLKDDVVAVSGGSRPSFQAQIGNGQIHPNVLKAIVSILANNPDLEFMNVSSAYRSESKTQHGLGQKIDVSRIKFQGGSEYSHIGVYTSRDPAGVQAWLNFAKMLKGTGILRHIITGGDIYKAVSADPDMEGIKIVRDDPVVKTSGGIHADHYDIFFDPEGEVGNFTFSLDPNCACGNDGGSFRRGGSGDFIKGVDEGKIILAAEDSNIEAYTSGKLNSATMQLLDSMATSQQFEQIDIISLFREPNNDFNRFHNNGNNGIGIDVGAIKYNGTLYRHENIVDGDPNSEGALAWVEFAKYLRDSGVVRQIITHGVLVDRIRQEDGMKAGPGQGNASNLRITTTPDGAHRDHFHIDVIADAKISYNDTYKSFAQRAKENSTKYIRFLGGDIVVEAAFGSRPQSYDDLTEKHQEFLGEIAEDNGYVAYRDVGRENDQMRVALNAMKAAAEAEGITLNEVSTYRSYDTQVQTFFNPSSSVTNPIDKYYGDDILDSEADIVRAQYEDRMQVSAAPGWSEHSTGLAVDFEPVNNSFASTAAYNWLTAITNPSAPTDEQVTRAGTFGFTLSYPEGSTQGATFEPWHWRFDGNDVYKLDAQIGDFTTEGRLVTERECLCTNTVSPRGVSDISNIDEDDGSNNNLFNQFKNVAKGIIFGVDAEAAIELDFIGDYEFDPGFNDDPEFDSQPDPSRYDLRKAFYESDIDGNDELAGYRYYIVRSNFNRTSNPSAQRQEFHDEIANILGYEKPGVSTSYDDRFFDSLNRLNIKADEHGLAVDFSIITDDRAGLRNINRQVRTFYSENNFDYDGDGSSDGDIARDLNLDGFTNGEDNTAVISDRKLWDEWYDVIPSLGPRVNELLSQGNNNTQTENIVRNETGIRINIPDPGDFSTNFNYTIIIEGDTTEEFTVEEMMTFRDKSIQAYVDRAFYFPPIGYDDRSTGQFATIFDYLPFMLKDQGGYIEDLTTVDTSESNAKSIFQDIENSKTFPREVLDVFEYDDEGFSSDYLVQFGPQYNVLFDPNSVNSELDLQNNTFDSNKDLIPTSIREGEANNKINVMQWLNQFSPQFGLVTAKTGFGQLLSQPLTLNIVNITSEYEISNINGEINVVTDQDDIPQVNNDYVDPNLIGNDLANAQTGEDFEGTSQSGELTRFTRSDALREQIENNADLIQGDEGEQRILAMGAYIESIPDPAKPGQNYSIAGQLIPGTEDLDGEGNPIQGTGDFEEDINVFRLRQALQNRRIINTAKGDPSTPDFIEPITANPDQQTSNRVTFFNALNEREKRLYDHFDGDWELTVESVETTTGTGENQETIITYEYSQYDPNPIDIFRVENGVFNYDEPDDDDLEDLGKGDTPDDPPDGNDFSGISFNGNPREREAFVFYEDLLALGNDERAYAQNYTNSVNFSAGETPTISTKYNTPVVIRGNNAIRQSLSELYQYYIYDESQDVGDAEFQAPPIKGFGNIGGGDVTSTNCTRVTGDFDGTFQNVLPGGTIVAGFDQIRGNAIHGALDISACGLSSSSIPPSAAEQQFTCDKPVLAAAPGVVNILTPAQSGGCGNTVEIIHADGWKTQYCHLNRVDVSQDETIDGGIQIGTEGNTGYSGGVHLHFAVFKDNIRVDPCENGYSCN